MPGTPIVTQMDTQDPYANHLAVIHLSFRSKRFGIVKFIHSAKRILAAYCLQVGSAADTASRTYYYF